jgi:hypothetical protein
LLVLLRRMVSRCATHVFGRCGWRRFVMWGRFRYNRCLDIPVLRYGLCTISSTGVRCRRVGFSRWEWPTGSPRTRHRSSPFHVCSRAVSHTGSTKRRYLRRSSATYPAYRSCMPSCRRCGTGALQARIGRSGRSRDLAAATMSWQGRCSLMTCVRRAPPYSGRIPLSTLASRHSLLPLRVAWQQERHSPHHGGDVTHKRRTALTRDAAALSRNPSATHPSGAAGSTRLRTVPKREENW